MKKYSLLQQYLPVYKYVQSELYVLKQRKQCLSKVNVSQYRVHVHTFEITFLYISSSFSFLFVHWTSAALFPRDSLFIYSITCFKVS
jgi:hypothetical protein